MARQRNIFASLKYLQARFAGQMPVVPEYSFDNNKQLQIRGSANDRDWPLIGNDASDITQLGNPNGVNALALSTSQLATPSAPTVTVVGAAGATTWAYTIVAKSGNGSVLGVTAASSAGQTTTGNATLSTTNFNTITWTAVAGAVSYDIYRTTAGGTPSTTGKIGNLKVQIISEQTIAPTFNDTGLAGDSTTAPTVNTTGAALFAGPVTFSGPASFSDSSTLTAITTAGAGTYTAAAMVGAGNGLNVITRNCNGASRTDTTDTAANIVAAIPGVAVGSSFQFIVKNISSAGQTVTVAGGSGVTFPNDAQLTIVSGESQPFLGRVTNVGTPAVTLYVTDSYGTAITDTNGNPIVGLTAASSAINAISVTNAATTVSPVIGIATTTDANVNVVVTPKGSGGLCSGAAAGQFGPLSHIMSDFAIATSNTALTAAQMIDGIIRVTAGTNTNATDTAANIVAAIPNCQVGSTFEMMVINGSGNVETLTLGTNVTAAAGVTVTLTIATGTAKRYLFRVTNVGTPAVTIYETAASTL